MQLKNSKVTTAVGILAVAIIVTLGLWYSLFTTGEIIIFNSNPYPTAVGVKYQTSADNWTTIGWIVLEPGEKKTISATFYRNEPKFFVAAESHNKGLLKWLLETGDTIYFDNATDEVTGNLPKDRNLNFEQKGSDLFELEEVQFDLVNSEEVYVLTDPLFHDAILNNEGIEVKSEDEGFQLIKEKARNLYESLVRQKTFDETFKSEDDLPTIPEFTMEDDPERGFMLLGVKISNVLPATLHGDVIQLSNGDLIIGIRSQPADPVTPVFDAKDVLSVVHDHSVDSENGGITKPLHFLVIRNGELLEIQSYFLFNHTFDWGADETDGQAFWEGALNSLFLGYWAEVKGAFSSDPKTTWKTTQRIYRAKQLRPRAARVGEIAGILVPTPTKILKIGSVAKTGKVLQTTRTVAKSAGIELVKFAVYDYKTSVSKPKSQELTVEMVQQMIPMSRGINLLQGITIKGTEPVLKSRKQFFDRS